MSNGVILRVFQRIYLIWFAHYCLISNESDSWKIRAGQLEQWPLLKLCKIDCTKVTRLQSWSYILKHCRSWKNKFWKIIISEVLNIQKVYNFKIAEESEERLQVKEWCKKWRTRNKKLRLLLKIIKFWIKTYQPKDWLRVKD